MFRNVQPKRGISFEGRIFLVYWVIRQSVEAARTRNIEPVGRSSKKSRQVGLLKGHVLSVLKRKREDNKRLGI